MYPSKQPLRNDCHPIQGIKLQCHYFYGTILGDFQDVIMENGETILYPSGVEKRIILPLTIKNKKVVRYTFSSRPLQFQLKYILKLNSNIYIQIQNCQWKISIRIPILPKEQSSKLQQEPKISHDNRRQRILFTPIRLISFDKKQL